MKTGGIFSQPNALGIDGFGAVGTSCTPDNSQLIRGIQQYLSKNGAPNLRVDGVWQGCTASAYNKVWKSPLVTCASIKTMTGLDCSGNDCTGGIVPSLSVPGMFQCMDGSDFGGPGQEATKCPSGQTWNATIGYCVLTGIPGLPDTSQPTTQSTGCPAGQINVPLLGCQPNPLATQTQPNQTTPPASGGCPEGQIGYPPACFPNPMAPAKPGQNCPSGSIYTPTIGCVSTTSPGTVTTPMACPEGQTNVPLFGCMSIPGFPGGSGTTAAGGGCPAGQIGLPPACFPNPFASKTDPTTGQPTDLLGGLLASIGKVFGQGTNCPAGSIYNPLTQQCTGSSGPVPELPGPGTPGYVVSDVPASPFGDMSYVIYGLLVVGLGAAAWYVLKPAGGGEAAMSEEEFQALLASEGLDGGGMVGMDPYADPYAAPYSQYAMNRKRRGRKSRRRGRGRRR
jgi:hypothetical protein